jgi:cell division protein FtsQ
MHPQKGKKIFIYIFLLLLVGTINNSSLNELRFKKINYINIVGLGADDNLVLLNKITNLNLGNIFSINKKKISNQINSNNLVEKFFIFKKYPSSLNIIIEKTKFLAKINKDKIFFLVGSNGKLINDNLSNSDLPFIFGNPKIDDFLNFKKLIDQSKISYSEIKNFYFFPSRRWDLELKNNVIIKLPSKDTKESISIVYEFLHKDEFKDIKLIDARIKDQVILND